MRILQRKLEARRGSLNPRSPKTKVLGLGFQGLGAQVVLGGYSETSNPYTVRRILLVQVQKRADSCLCSHQQKW